MIRGFLTRRAEWPARIADPDALPPLTVLWREVGSLARAIGGRIRPLPPEPNPDSEHPPVMVLPGFLSGDWATKALRADLRRAGFRTNATGRSRSTAGIWASPMPPPRSRRSSRR